MTMPTDFGSSIDMDVCRIRQGQRTERKQPVATEVPCTIMVNDVEIATLLASPDGLKELAYGFMLASGIIKTADQITRCIVDTDKWIVHAEMLNPPDLSSLGTRLFTSGCGRGVTYSNPADLAMRHPLESSLSMDANHVVQLGKWLQEASTLHRTTGCVHTAGLSERGELPAVQFDDIGRHNAVDKAIGHALMGNQDFSSMILVTSGRISSEIFQKARRATIPIIIARSAPTHQTILRARDTGITIVGFARGETYTIYSHKERVILA